MKQTVSWSAKDNKPISLGEMIASRFPSTAEKLGIPLPQAQSEEVKLVGELSPDELKRVVCEQLRSQRKDVAITIIDKGTFKRDDQIEQVLQGTSVGNEIVGMAKIGMSHFETMIKKGKIKGISDGKTKLKTPDFDF